MLSDDEALAVVLGLIAGRRLGVIAASSAVEGALAKLDRVLPTALRERVRATQETVELGLRRAAGSQPFDAGLLLTLGGAALDRWLTAARERVPPTIGTLAQRADGVLLRFGADNLGWAVRYLVGLDCPFTVREPRGLRDSMRELAAQLAAAADEPVAGR